jgi:hypothetical protein
VGCAREAGEENEGMGEKGGVAETTAIFNLTHEVGDGPMGWHHAVGKVGEGHGGQARPSGGTVGQQ